MESGFGLFAEALGSIVASSYFEVEPAHIAAIVLILDS